MLIHLNTKYKYAAQITSQVHLLILLPWGHGKDRKEVEQAALKSRHFAGTNTE